MAVHRILNLADLDAIFERETTGGKWINRADEEFGAGTYPCVALDHFQAAESVRTLTVKSSVMASWTGADRHLRIRTRMLGSLWNSPGLGLLIEWKGDDQTSWAVLRFQTGIFTSNSLSSPISELRLQRSIAGSMIADTDGVDHRVVVSGGWIDFEIDVPDTCNELRLRWNAAGSAVTLLGEFEFEDGTGSGDAINSVAPVTIRNAQIIKWGFVDPDAAGRDHALPISTRAQVIIYGGGGQGGSGTFPSSETNSDGEEEEVLANGSAGHAGRRTSFFHDGDVSGADGGQGGGPGTIDSRSSRPTQGAGGVGGPRGSAGSAGSAGSRFHRALPGGAGGSPNGGAGGTGEGAYIGGGWKSGASGGGGGGGGVTTLILTDLSQGDHLIIPRIGAGGGLANPFAGPVGGRGFVVITPLVPEDIAAEFKYGSLAASVALTIDAAPIGPVEADLAVGHDLEVLVELELDDDIQLDDGTQIEDGTQRFSISGIRSADGHYAERLISISAIEQALSPVPDDYRAPEITVVLDDADNKISQLRAAAAFRNRTLRIRLGRVSLGEDDFETIFEGEVRGWSKSGTEFELTVGSLFHERFEKLVTPHRVVTAARFPNAHASAVSRLVPLVVGEINTRTYDGSGAVEALLIDTARNRYAFAQDDAAGSARALNVYVDGALATTGWTQEGLTFDGLRCRVITFSASQESATVTVDVRGLPDENGALSSNPVRVLRRFLIENDFTPADFDEDSLAEAELKLGALGIRASLWAVSADTELRDVMYDFTRSTNVVFYASREGLIAADVPEPPGETSARPEPAAIITEADIVRDSLRIKSLDRVASTLSARYRYSPANNEYEGLARYTSDAQLIALRRDVYERSEMPYQFVSASALNVLEDREFYMQEDRVLVEFDADPSFYRALHVGHVIQLTHFAGLGKTGFTDKLFRIVSISLRLSDRALLTGLSLVDT